MRDIDVGTKYFEHKRKKHYRSPEVCVISSESEVSGDESEKVSSGSEESDHVSLSSDSSRDRIVVESKKRTHRSRHKQLDGKVRQDDGGDSVSHNSRKHHHHDRKGHHRCRHKEEAHRKRQAETTRTREEPSDYPKRKHHQESTSSERVKHRRSREDTSDRGEASHRRTSLEHSRDQRKNVGGKERDRGRKQHYSSEVNKSRKASVSIKKEPGSEDESKYEWGKKPDDKKDSKSGPQENKAKPNFEPSGKLAEETNTFNGVLIKYSEPPEARKPKRRWRLYPFKGDQGLPTLYIHRQSCYLIGRERKVADIPADHPSCSKQHAALQYRLVPYKREDGSSGRRVRPYIIDLESSNGTFVNNVKIETKKYVELMEKDVIKFGYSSREYVLLHEHSKDDEADDDVAV